MRLSSDLFDVFAFLDRPRLDKAAYVCRRFNAVIEEKRMNSLCLRTMDKVLIEGESTAYNITLWTAHGADPRSSLQFRRVHFQDKLRMCLRRSVINVLRTDRRRSHREVSCDARMWTGPSEAPGAYDCRLPHTFYSEAVTSVLQGLAGNE